MSATGRVRHHGGVHNRIVEGDDYSVFPAPIMRLIQGVGRLFGRSCKSGSGDGVYEVVSRPDGNRVLVTAGPHGRGTLDRPGKWMAEAAPFPPVRVVAKWYRRDLDRDEAVRLATLVIGQVQSGRWRPGDGEPDADERP